MSHHHPPTRVTTFQRLTIAIVWGDEEQLESHTLLVCAQWHSHRGTQIDSLLQS